MSLSLLKQLRLTPAQMVLDLNRFGERISELSNLLGINLADYKADHIALRINDAECAKLAHQMWAQKGQVISQSEINGRPIVVVQLAEPLVVQQWSIEFLELPYPAPGKVYPQQGWEHLELVIASQAQTAQDYLDDLLQRFPPLAARWNHLAQAGVKVKLSSPQGAHERLANPTLAFKYQGVCIKLHPHSLQSVILSETR